MSAIHPLATRPPYALAYLGYQISAIRSQMMEPDLFKKLICNNFCKCLLFIMLADLLHVGAFPVADSQLEHGSQVFMSILECSPEITLNYICFRYHSCEVVTAIINSF